MNRLRLTISIDDGHPLDLQMAALLDRHQMQASFYVPITNDEGPPVLTGPQMRALAQRFEIGSHTLSHRFLDRLDEGSAWRQIRDGKQALEDELDMPVHGFCYPGGRYRRLHKQQVQAAGFRFARTTRNLRIDAGAHAFELPTTAQFYPHPRAVWLRNFISQGDWIQRSASLRIVLREADWLVRLHRLLALAETRGTVFHLWYHSLDIEQLQLWKELDRFLAHMARRVPPAQRITNGDLFTHGPGAMRPLADSPIQRYAGQGPDGGRCWPAVLPSTPSGSSAI